LLPTCPAESSRIILRGLEWFITELGEQSDGSQVWSLTLKRIIKKTA
jgi:hypothetical protein